MPVLTIRKAASTRSRGHLMRAVRRQASGLLQLSEQPVLVVYGKDDARIYYEREPPAEPNPLAKPWSAKS